MLVGKQTVLKAVGATVTLLCVVFFAHSFMTSNLEPLVALPRVELVAVILVAALGYASLLVAVGVGFAELVQAAGYGLASTQEGVALWGRANLAKYIPGNVMHFAGRQILARRVGWPQSRTAAASVLELALQVLISCTIGIIALLLAGQRALGGGAAWLAAAIAVALAVLAVALLGRLPLARLPDLARRLLTALRLVDLRAFARSILYHTVFFVGSGIIGWLVYSWLAGNLDALLLPGMVAVVLLGWCAGLLVPGAPGGIGVREATMIVIGSGFLDHDSLVLATVLLRVISLAGEGLLFVLACALPLRPRASKAAPGSARQRQSSAPTV